MKPSFFEHLSKVLTEVPIEDWRPWMLTRVLRSAAPYLTDDFVETNFDFYGRTLNGTPELRARWKRGVALVEGAIGRGGRGASTSPGTSRPRAKAQMDDLVANLLEAYRQSIAALDWMSEETKQRAYEKLDDVPAQDRLPRRVPRLLRAARPRRRPDRQRRRGGGVRDRPAARPRSARPVDRDEWLMLPQTVNAYYNPGTNEICFPAGILQKPFFDADADEAENYGGIGAVIGHEIGHGFDDQGAQYDGAGNLNDWWTPDDKAAFEVKSKALIEQYDAFEPRNLPGRAGQRRADRRREHRRPRRADDRPPGLRDRPRRRPGRRTTASGCS